MLQTFTSLLKNKETRNRILFTLAMLLIYRNAVDLSHRFRYSSPGS